jgi:proteasome lid subunit RPN8/RPN11
MLRIFQSVLDELRAHGEQTYPHECCGVLLGHLEGDRGNPTFAKSGQMWGTVVMAGVRCGNTRLDSPENRYHIDPRELVRVQRESRARGLDIVGFYHSHPDHPARWSPTDLAEAHWFGCSYVITAVERGRAGATNSFLLCGSAEEDKHFEEEEIVVARLAEIE